MSWSSEIVEWQQQTFGPLKPGKEGAERAYERVCEEWTELENTPLGAASANIDECADIVITLCAYVDHIGGDLAEAVERKMKKNRARKWRRTGDGCGYHIKDTDQ